MEDAYAAGLFDGEGCVLVREVVTKGEKTGGLDYKLTLANTDRTVLGELCSAYGGNVSPNGVPTKNKICYLWTLGPKQAVPFIHRILPYSRIKRSQLEHYLWMRDNLRRAGRFNPLTDEERGDRTQAVEALKRLRA